MNIYDLISRAQKLRKETQLDSVSPDRVGSLQEDTLKYINESQLLASSPSLHKIYASVSAMQSDGAPKSDLTGKPLKPGQLVVIVPESQTDATAGDVYRYDGPSGNTSAWTFVAKIGAVPADAELSAISTNPPQNKVVTEKLTELESEFGIGKKVDLSALAQKNCSLGAKTWYYNYNGGSFHKAIAVDAKKYDQITITADFLALIGFVTDAYNGSAIEGASIPYVTGTSRIEITANTTTTLSIPKEAAYIIITTKDGGGNMPNFSQVELTPTSPTIPMLKKDVETLTEQVEELGLTKKIDLSNFAQKKCSLGATSWYDDVYIGGCFHKAIAVDTKEYSQITITADFLALVGFVTDVYNGNPQNGDTIPYVSGTSRISVVANTTTTLPIPKNTAYIIITTRDGGGNVPVFSQVELTPTNALIPQLKKDVEEVTKYVEQLGVIKSVDLSSLTERKCSLGASSWFYSPDINSGYHKAIIVDAEMYDQITITADFLALIGFVTDAYNGNPQNGDTIPYVSGTSRIRIEANTTTTVSIPKDTAYIIITTKDGGGNVPNFSQIDLSASEGIITKLIDKVYNLPTGSENESIEYEGERISFGGRTSFKVFGEGVLQGIHNNLAAQGMAIHNGYLFQIYNLGECLVYKLNGETPVLVNSFALGTKSQHYHANSCQFGKDVTETGFPLLYVGYYYDRKLAVEKVTTTSGELLQTISIATLDSFPNGVTSNIVKGDDGFIWVVCYYENRLHFTKMRCPSLSEGDVELTQSDVLDSWSVAYNYDEEVYQDMKVYNGKLYLQYGGTYNKRGVKVYDVDLHRQISNVDLTQYITEEFEGIDIYNNKMWITLYASNKGYVLTFF